jgi:hypothetical protein
MQFERRGLGYRPDLRHLLGHVDRDAAARLSAAPAPPAEKDNDWLVLDILDQGGAPFCVANATAQAVRCGQVSNGVIAPRLASRLWLMFLAHAIEHMEGAFDGTYIRNAFEVLERLGFPPEEAWPYDDSPSGRFKVKPPTDAFRQAHDQIAPFDYQRIYSTGAARVDDVKRALAGGNVVVFGTNVSWDFCDNKGTAKPIDPPVTGSPAGTPCCGPPTRETRSAARIAGGALGAWTDGSK